LMEGDAERTCLENGWSGKQPECIFVKCPDPKDVPNAILTSDAKSPFQLGDKLAYSCQDGYKASGSLSRECQRGGVWSGSDPVCQFVDCGNPPVIDNANVTMVNGRTSFNAAADYTCHPDYLPAGIVIVHVVNVILAIVLLVLFVLLISIVLIISLVLVVFLGLLNLLVLLVSLISLI
jgi:hypothetical protein